jgi:hypothetical protein
MWVSKYGDVWSSGGCDDMMQYKKPEIRNVLKCVRL